jgi:hypothetical protein
MGEMNEALAGLVERFDSPEIRLFRTTPIIEEYAHGDLDVATPDGFHYTPHLHQMIGRELAHQIMDWAKTQPHLEIPG